MKTDKYNPRPLSDEYDPTSFAYDPGRFAMDVQEDIQTIKACLKFILQSYERAEGHPGALVVDGLLEKLEEHEKD